jgi:polygalacturonase
MKKYFILSMLLGTFSAGSSLVLMGQQKEVRPEIPSGTTITVGLKNADIIGSDNKAIQAAIDLVALRGGGTVQILPGEYILDDAIRLRSNIHLKGDREKTILKHAPAISSPLIKDADIGQKEVTPKDASLFKVGMGLVVRSKEYQGEMVNRPTTIVRIENGVLYLKDYIEFDFTADFDGPQKVVGRGVATNIFPLIFGWEVENVEIEGLTVDEKTEATPPGWINARVGGVTLKRTKNGLIKDVNAINSPGDGILISSCEHITTINCLGAYNTYHGLHCGAHSPWTIVRNSTFHHNGSDGVYICWGVREGEFTDNIIYNNGIREITNFPDRGKRGGISIGHKDTDNLIARNHIYENARYGVYFRTKTEPNGAHRNTLKDNIIENNGLKGHVTRATGITICGITHDLVFENNTIRETRQGDDRLQKGGIVIEPGVSNIKMVNNKISGHPEQDIVDNSKNPKPTADSAY